MSSPRPELAAVIAVSRLCPAAERGDQVPDMKLCYYLSCLLSMLLVVGCTTNAHYTTSHTFTSTKWQRVRIANYPLPIEIDMPTYMTKELHKFIFPHGGGYWIGRNLQIMVTMGYWGVDSFDKSKDTGCDVRVVDGLRIETCEFHAATCHGLRVIMNCIGSNENGGLAPDLEIYSSSDSNMPLIKHIAASIKVVKRDTLSAVPAKR